MEVALVDPAAVEQDQCAIGLARGIASEVVELNDLSRAIAGRLLRRGHAGC
jgi:hypothetical protein